MQTQQHLFVFVPAPLCEAAFGGFRTAHSRFPPVNLPLHITLKSPLAHDGIEVQEVIERLRQICSAQNAFEVLLTHLDSFPQAEVLYLAPAPSKALDSLAATIEQAFRGNLQAELVQPIFHVTIAHLPDDMARARVEFSTQGIHQLPIRERIDRVEVYSRQENAWSLVATLPLG